MATTFEQQRSAPDGVLQYDVAPIITSASIDGAWGVMAYDKEGILRVITDRKFNRYTDEDGVRHGSYEHGFVDFSTLHHVSSELEGNEGVRWVVGEQVAILGLEKYVRELENRLPHLAPADNMLVPAKIIEFEPKDHLTAQIDMDNETTQLFVPEHAITDEDIAGIASCRYSAIDGVVQLLAAAELGEGICLGPEDPTVVRLKDGTVRVFITLAARDSSGSSTFETLMLRGASLYDLEAVGFVPVGMMKEMCFGPEYQTLGGPQRMVLGEGSFTGYSTVRSATVGADFELDSFRDSNLVSMLPSNVHDRFAAFYDGTTNTPEEERYQWVSEHISPNKVLDHDVIPLSDGWHAVMTSGRSRGKDADADNPATMGPFEVGLMVVQLDPSHKYAGQCVWVDDRPLFRLAGAESITFGSDWYIKQDGMTGMDRTIVFIVHRDDKDICPVEMPLRAVWDRLPVFLREHDEATTTAAAEAVIAPHINLSIEQRHGNDYTIAA